jgi:hypothetical protein
MSTSLHRDIWIEFPATTMLKNVKIDEETHRELSVRTALLSTQKGLLCAVLIRAGLQKFTDEELKMMLSVHVTSDGIER